MEFEKVASNVYLNEKVLRRIREGYYESGEILKLDGFFNQIEYEMLLTKLKDFNGEYKKITDKYSYENLGEIKELGGIFTNKVFSNFISSILGRKIKDIDFRVLRFKHRDYTLLHDSENLREGVEWFMFFTNFWDESFGGHMVYSNLDDPGESFVFPVIENSFVLIKKRGNFGRFVKYINHLAGSRKFILVDGRIVL